MNFLHLANELIPGYDTLPTCVRTAFENTVVGKELTKSAHKLDKMIHSGFFAQFFQDSDDDEDDSVEEKINMVRFALQDKIGDSNEYQRLTDQINRQPALTNMHKEMLKHVKSTYLNLLNTTCQNHINVLNLEQFNIEHANTLAQRIFSTDEWLEKYKTALQEQIKNNIGLIDNKNPFPKTPTLSKKSALNSLANLYSYMCSVRDNQEEVQWCVNHLNQIADAHGFLQATGFATQNETSWLAVFDLVNYFRLAGNIAETKTILSKFLQPFMPLLLEYSDLNKEQDVVRQIVRTVMPMVIVSAAVILVSALLSAFVIPEVAFLFILLPTVYLGRIAASGYVVMKDQIYNDIRQYWYGQYDIPEYQFNEGMIASFGSEEKAKMVRDFYINEIKICASTEMDYQAQTKLNQVSQDKRKANANRNRELQFEWYDIHSNPNLSTDATVKIALNRLQLEGRKVCDAIHNQLNTDINKEIPELIHQVADEIRASVERSILPKVQELKIAYTEQPRFFAQPACFKQREEMVRLYRIQEQIRP